MRQKFRLAESFRLAALVATLALVGLANATVPAQRQQDAFATTVENFGKVNDQYYRGEQPTQEEFGQLKKLGIKTVIDLRKDYKPEAGAWARSWGLQYVNIPLTASRAATEEQTAHFLSLVNNPANWPVYVHCKGGRHRTGAMTAVYRITHDKWTADQAFKEMKEYDFNNNIFGGPPAQKKFVYSFYERYQAQSGHK